MNDQNNFNHESFMYEALREPEEAGERGDRPIVAVLWIIIN